MLSGIHCTVNVKCSLKCIVMKPVQYSTQNVRYQCEAYENRNSQKSLPEINHMVNECSISPGGAYSAHKWRTLPVSDGDGAAPDKDGAIDDIDKR